MKSFSLAPALLCLLIALYSPVQGGTGGNPSAAIGRSLEGRPIESTLTGLPGTMPVAKRPRILVVAGLDADRRAGTDVAQKLPAALEALAEKDKRLAALLSEFAVEVIAVANPDAAEALRRGPDRELAWNMRPVDEDRDGEVDEDGPQDLNGDGMITVMRRREPRGTHRISEEDERLLVPADPRLGERGEWRIYPEGLDSDGDGIIAEDPPGGVGLDRNFAHGWARHDRTAGTSAPSEPETRALIDHVLANPQIACVLVYGRGDNLTVVAGANTAGIRKEPNGPLADDLPWIRHGSNRFKEITGQDAGPGDAPGGAFHQWACFQHGLPAFCTPLVYPGIAGKKLTLPSGEEPKSDEGRWLAFSDATHGGNGFVPWESFDHPSLGEVEIGGFAPGLARRAPPYLLATLVEQQARFVAALLEAFPRAVWRVAGSERLADGAYRVRATLSSEGVFPLVTAMARTARSAAPVRVSIESDGLLQGRAEKALRRLAGSDRVRELRWVVRGKPGGIVRLRATSERGGTADVQIDLE